MLTIKTIRYDDVPINIVYILQYILVKNKRVCPCRSGIIKIGLLVTHGGFDWLIRPVVPDVSSTRIIPLALIGRDAVGHQSNTHSMNIGIMLTFTAMNTNPDKRVFIPGDSTGCNTSRNSFLGSYEIFGPVTILIYYI
jgi:hypothetical protein